MSLFLRVALTMVAFAANSVLNRLGVAGGATDPITFALIRLVSGAVALCLLVWVGGGSVPLMRRARLTGAGALALYMIGFSLAYLSLDAGVGALILFGVVQIVIFSAMVLRGEAVAPARWQGAVISLAGLAYLLLPGAVAPDLMGAALMVAAGIGWGLYTLAGRAETDALGATAGNFAVASVVLLVCFLLLPGVKAMTVEGLTYAVLSGVLTSALGYALWYRVLPLLHASTAGVAQLTVPVIALLGGVIFLGEQLTLSFVLASALVLGGVAWSLRPAS